MADSMADKDKNDNVEHKKMQEEQNLIEKAYNMLIKQYGYSKSQTAAQGRYSGGKASRICRVKGCIS